MLGSFQLIYFSDCEEMIKIKHLNNIIMSNYPTNYIIHHKSFQMLDTVKGFGTLETYTDQNKSKNLDYSTPKLNIGGTDGFFTAEVKRGIDMFSFISKSKGQSLFQAFQICLQSQPNYQNFIQPYCFPSFSSQVMRDNKTNRPQFLPPVVRATLKKSLF